MSRRGSSMFAPGGAMPAGGAAAPPKLNPPAPAVDPNAKRQSVVLQPMAGGIGLVDYDDSDYESEEEEEPPKSSSVPGVSGNAPGPNHRPMVGGFAAAAYEAARAYHYAQQQKGKAPAPVPPPQKRAGGRPQGH